MRIVYSQYLGALNKPSVELQDDLTFADIDVSFYLPDKLEYLV